MITHSPSESSLPCRADRKKFMDESNRVLAEARLVGEQSDRTMARLAAGQPAQRALEPKAGKQPTVNSA